MRDKREHEKEKTYRSRVIHQLSLLKVYFNNLSSFILENLEKRENYFIMNDSWNDSRGTRAACIEYRDCSQTFRAAGLRASHMGLRAGEDRTIISRGRRYWGVIQRDK